MLRYSTAGITGDQGLVDGLVLGVGADGAGSGHGTVLKLIQGLVALLYDVGGVIQFKEAGVGFRRVVVRLALWAQSFQAGQLHCRS